MITKFKAYDLNEKEWIDIRYIELRDDGSLWYVQAWDECERDIAPPYFEEDLGKTWALMQSTGLLDKNGKEIFEGDIVKNEINEVGYIEWSKCRFNFCDSVGHFYLFSIGARQPFEIIGNIYEHPHLLEEE